MNRVTSTLLITVALVGLAASPLAVADFQHSGRYPNSVQVSGQHANLRSANQGRFSWANVYQTDDGLPAVVGWYVARYQVKPMPGSPKPGQCVLLTKTTHYGVIRQATDVTVCPAAHGTQVYFGQTLFLQ